MERQTPVLEGYLTPDELARQIGVSVRTLSRWHVHRNGPPRLKVGKQVFYRLASVLSWLEGREQKERRK